MKKQAKDNCETSWFDIWKKHKSLSEIKSTGKRMQKICCGQIFDFEIIDNQWKYAYNSKSENTDFNIIYLEENKTTRVNKLLPSK